jgi:uncharacterized protein
LLTGHASRRIDYDGSQLRSGWLHAEMGLELGGEAHLGFFIGACDVKAEFVVDMDEVLSGEAIRAELMLHFIAEFPERSLEKMVLRQRLLTALVFQALNQACPDKKFRRCGDDIYEGKYKITISIATLSPESSLLHFAINIDASGAPVAAKGLNDYGIEPQSFAEQIITSFAEEMAGVKTAQTKVRFVQ